MDSELTFCDLSFDNRSRALEIISSQITVLVIVIHERASESVTLFSPSNGTFFDVLWLDTFYPVWRRRNKRVGLGLNAAYQFLNPSIECRWVQSIDNFIGNISIPALSSEYSIYTVWGWRYGMEIASTVSELDFDFVSPSFPGRAV